MIMTIYQWIQLALVCLMGAMSPGPSLALIIRNTIKKNRFNGILTAISHGLAVSIYALFAVLGLGFLLQTHQEFFIGLKILGSISLLILGIYFFINAKTIENNNYNKQKLSSNSFLQGFFVAFLNPKILVFFVALFSQFISTEATKMEKLILVLTSGIIDIIWYVFVAVFITTYSIKKFIYSHTDKIEKFMGILLILVSVSILYKFI